VDNKLGGDKKRMRRYDSVPILPPGFLEGIPNPIWRTYRKHIAAFIKKNRLEPDQISIANIKSDVSESWLEEWIEFITGRFGGDRGPHVHFNGNVYTLNQKQWNDFSAPIIKDFSSKLNEVRTVNFDTFMEMSGIMNAMR
jgi:hypothetical protein